MSDGVYGVCLTNLTFYLNADDVFFFETENMLVADRNGSHDQLLDGLFIKL